MSSSRDLWPFFLLEAFPYYGPHFLSHSFCLHQELIHLAAQTPLPTTCMGDTAVFAVMLDLVLIALTCGIILHTVTRLASQEELCRAFHTYASHLCAVLVFFVSVVGLYLVHCFGKHAPHSVYLLMASVYFCVCHTEPNHRQ